MGWWSSFDRAEVAADFDRIADSGLDSVRVFLLWEDFQPSQHEVDCAMLERLVAVADLAGDRGLALIPTLFTGHMSGVNWIPRWALGGRDRDDRFRVVARREVVEARLRNWYADPMVEDAQVLFATEAAAALAGHEAVWAWDLGNENSNCVIPPTTALGRDWLVQLSGAIHSVDETALVTVGLHMEDLEEDRHLGPRDAADVCDFLSMHGYPIYASFAHGATDANLLPFLARITRWLGTGRDVVFTEFGLPTGASSSGLLVDEDRAAAYTTDALEGLRSAGCLGAMLWCYSDYDAALWDSPPFDRATHERTFGLWRADGSPKPAVAAVTAFAGAERCAVDGDDAWIDGDPSDQPDLPRLYERYLSSRAVQP